MQVRHFSKLGQDVGYQLLQKISTKKLLNGVHFLKKFIATWFVLVANMANLIVFLSQSYKIKALLRFNWSTKISWGQQEHLATLVFISDGNYGRLLSIHLGIFLGT